MLKTVEEVIDNSLCTGCGTCAGVCSAGALAMTETPDGRLTPVKQPELCNSCNLCLQSCPQIKVPSALKAGWKDLCVGEIRDGFLATASEPGLLQRGQSGGVVTALLKWMLEAGRIDRVVVTRFDPLNPLVPRVEVTDDPEILRQSQGSIYCPVAMNVAVQQVLESAGRVAFVGLGCHMQGLARAMQAIPKLRDLVLVRIGLFCSGTMTFGGQDFLLHAKGLRRDHIRRFAYRDKTWRGWPGDVLIENIQGRTYNIPHAARRVAKIFYRPAYCHICIDKMNLLADLVVGDAYGLCEDDMGLAEVLVRTRAGEHIWREAGQAGAVQSRRHDPADIAERQAGRLSVHRAAQYARAWEDGPQELPDVWRDSPYATLKPSKSRVIIAWSLAARRKLQSARARRLFARFPVRLARSWNYLFQKCKSVHAVVWRMGGNKHSGPGDAGP